MSISPLKSPYEYESLPPSDDRDESMSLLGGTRSSFRPPASQLSPAALYRNFYAMSIAFALNHGCVTTCLAYSSTMLGNDMGSASSGCLYVAYAISAFLLAKPTVTMIGPKNGLLLGVIGYCVYVAGFLLAILFLHRAPVLSWVCSVAGGSIGGVAGGLLWTSQGRYFARNATLYTGWGQGDSSKTDAFSGSVDENGGNSSTSSSNSSSGGGYNPPTNGLSTLSTTRMPSSQALFSSHLLVTGAEGGGRAAVAWRAVEMANSNFSAIFAAAFLGIETATKLLATLFFLLTPDTAAYVVFFLYTLVASASVFVIYYLEDLDEPGSRNMTYKAISQEAGKVARLVYLDKRLLLLLPFQIAFGFASSFVPYYVFGTVIGGSATLGSTWVGLLSAVIVLTGASMALPAAWAANRLGKPVVMAVGGVCIACVGLPFLLLSDESMGQWVFILPYLVLYGVGRGVWETVNKAVIADFYKDSPDQCTTAFAATTFFNGYAAAMGYFTFSHLDRGQMAGLVLVSSLLAVVCCQLAFGTELHRVHIMREESKILQHRQNIIARADASRSKAARSARGGANGPGADSGEDFQHSEVWMGGASSSSASSASSASSLYSSGNGSSGRSGSNIDTSSQSGASTSSSALSSSSSSGGGGKGAKGRGLANAIRSPI